MAQLGGKEDNGTYAGPWKKNNRHGSLWELFTSVHFHRDRRKAHTPLCTLQQQATYLYKKNQCCTLTHGAQRGPSVDVMIIWLLSKRSVQVSNTSHSQQSSDSLFSVEPINHKTSLLLRRDDLLPLFLKLK